METRVHIKIYLSVKTDLNALWDEIKIYKGARLEGNDMDYLVYFDGEQADGLEVLRHCMTASKVGKFYADFGA